MEAIKESEVNTYLINEDLFRLFKKQLKKDFESSGIDAGFSDNLLPEWLVVKEVISRTLGTLSHSNSVLASLLYRVDIGEAELDTYQQSHSQEGFEDALAELIVKRILQKVILKKRFSE